MTGQAAFTLRGRNPDVLTCIANLSNDEVFTPPELACRMLDMLAEAWAADHGGADLWAEKTVRFLDPFTKSGVFLREITSRLTEGLAQQMPDLQERVDHILTQQVFGIAINTAAKKYLFTLAIVAVLTLAAKNLVRSAMGRSWMAVRDMDVAAEVIGIPILKTKLLAFAISSFYCGIAGALWAFVLLGTVDPQAFDLHRSFQVLFMIIVGGVGSILGSYLGAAFIVLLPIVLNLVGQLFHGAVSTQFLSNLEMMLFGGLIIFFLIVEPHGLARLWQIAKEKLRMWPFPH